ncbi:MAG: hypothetical protein ACTSVD_07540 [Candidatus Thorarchaeota archaeon]|nr:MAG: hypothetical protein DRO73_07215 [Candidatus Thorarchaeota archaeon]RLI61750.1 MAG: hypothetical protein DRO93_03335 [Candidatus Thorarchaeota archaeon]
MMSATTNVLAIVVSLLLFSPAIAVTHQTDATRLSATLSAWPGGMIIDHNWIDVGKITHAQLQSVFEKVRVHYAHTSHGGQITIGLDRLESANATLSVARGSNSLPSEDNALCIYDGNDGQSYITPDLYWQTEEGLNMTQNTLDNNPAITVSLWSWCTQLNYYTEEQTQEYLDAMAFLESRNPNVTFVYMTGNAQATGEDGYNRWLRNEQIRQYCRDNNKILFDFADLDSWSNGEQATYEYTVGGTTYNIPVEHEDFHGSEAGHTTYTSCEQKARAFWWLAVMIASGVTSQTTTQSSTTTSSPSSSTSTTMSTTYADIAQLLSSPTFFTLLLVGGIVVAAIVITRRGR